MVKFSMYLNRRVFVMYNDFVVASSHSGVGFYSHKHTNETFISGKQPNRNSLGKANKSDLTSFNAAEIRVKYR